MYVCICNAINERTVKSAIKGGASTVSQVFGSLGLKPGCGKCVCTIADMMSSQREVPNRAPSDCGGCGGCARKNPISPPNRPLEKQPLSILQGATA